MYISKDNTRKQIASFNTLGQVLKKYMDDNNIANAAAARLLSIDRKTLADVLNESYTNLKLSHAIKIASLLDISNEDMVRLYLNFVDDEEKENIDRASEAAFILDNFDLNSLKEAGVVTDTRKIDKVKEDICAYFGFNNIFEFNRLDSASVLFSKSRFNVAAEKERKMQLFWVKSAFYSFSKIDNPHEYDPGLLEEFLKRVKTFTKDVEFGFSKVQYILFQLGVTVLVQPYVTKTRAYGISMIVNDKPCIIITDQGKRYHKLWMTLFHELYHIVNDYEYISRTNLHISNPDSPDVFVSEEDADMFAVNILIPESVRKSVFKMINSPLKIIEAANKMDIHPSIIYGVYLETLDKGKTNLEYIKYTKNLTNSSKAIKNIVFDPVHQDGIVSAVNKMKRHLNIEIA